MRGLRRWDVLWFVLCAAASTAWCLSAAAELGPTFDEPIYFKRGLEAWRTGSHAGLLKLGTMPLPADVQTLPLFLWELWQNQEIDVDGDLYVALYWMRLGNLVFWWLLLLYGLLLGRMLAGPWGGRLAVALLASEPNFLAHAALATTDVPITACILAFCYHFRAGREQAWPRRVALPALLLGVAIMAKASAIVFCPICMAAIELDRLWRQGKLAWLSGASKLQELKEYWHRSRPALRDFLIMGLGGLVCAFILCGSDFRTQPNFVEWAHKLPEGPGATSLVWLADHLCIFSNAGEGIVRQIKHNLHGHGTYLLGNEVPRSVWYYFPIVLTIKLTLPLLITLAVVVAFRARTLGNWAIWTAVALLAYSPFFRVQIGIRMVLPLVAFGLVGLAGAVIASMRTDARPWRRWAFCGAVVACTLWAFAIAAAAWPNGLNYVNELWGGPERGYVVVSDANFDWGQGLPELTHWQRSHGETVDLWYFGTDPRWDKQPFHPLPLHALNIDGPEDVVANLHNRYFAVGTTMVYGMSMDSSHRAAAEFLRLCKPIAKTSTFLIFERRELEQACLPGSNPVAARMP
jgi:hypothetical protein